MTPASLDNPIFDCDNHYYEAMDAFTRHLDPRLAPRTVQWCEINGRKYHLVAGRVSRAVTNPTFDPIAMPGALYDFLRSNPEKKTTVELLRKREPIPAHYRHPEARLKVMDEQGLEAIWLFPTLGVLYEELLKHDTEAVTATFRSFNQWLEEDWGFAHAGRIFGAPYLTLADVDWAVRELEWALERGARVIVMRPAAVWTADGPRSPGDPLFDPFWARVNEAGIAVVIHAGDSGYTSHGYAPDGFSAAFGGGGSGGGKGDGELRRMRPSIKGWNMERAALDYLATLIFDRVFERFPAVRVASVENGSGFLPDLFRKLGGLGKKTRGYFQQDPLETFKNHVWINPFWEDDIEEVVEYMGPGRVIFGSDWPHIEGMAQPAGILDEIG
ncbi:MAG: amidohydrolase family protein, partial [Proteobacteria bacterium]|nr:amidohydrolase family protein [Pseudomonadota bacterium]